MQLTYGTMMVVLTVIVQAAIIALASSTLAKTGNWLASPHHGFKMLVALSILVLWMVFGLSISAWVWAGLFLLLDVISSVEEALYFSVVTFTTLGYGDVTLDDNWRLLGSLSAVNGLIIVGLNTAFLVEVITRIRTAQFESQEKGSVSV
jgi:voltage-gated potassium channel Kch